MSSNKQTYKKSNVKYISLTPREINDIVDTRNKLREKDETLSNAIILDLKNKIVPGETAKMHNNQYYRLAIYQEGTETYQPFKIIKGTFRTGSRPKGEYGDKKKEIMAQYPGKKWEDISMEERGPPQLFMTKFKCKMYDPETLDEDVTKEFKENPENQDLKPSEYTQKLEKYLKFVRDEQEWFQCHLNIYDATNEIFSEDNAEWLYENLNGYTLVDTARSHVQALCNADDETMLKLKKENPKKWKEVVANKGLIELDHPWGTMRTKMNFNERKLLQTTFRDASNIGADRQPRRPVCGSYSKPKVQKPLDYANFNYWLNPGSYCVNCTCEVRVLTSNRAPTTHCYWYEATVLPVASTRKEKVMEDDDRDMLASLGLGLVSPQESNEDDGDDFNPDDNVPEDDDVPPAGDADGDLANLANLVIKDED